MEIQKAIKELRKQYNMSQSDLADGLMYLPEPLRHTRLAEYRSRTRKPELS